MPRVIRKLDIAGRPTFDEQLWPINALLVVLSAVVAGMIIGTSQFTYDLNWQNGWLRLATLVVTVGLLVALAWWFRGSIGRRFQLGAAASLLAHAVIAILLYFQHLDLFQPVPSAVPRDTAPVLVRYEYQVRAPDEQTPQEAHERPVDTPTPEDRPIELTRTPNAEPRIDEPQPLPVPETQPAVEPTQVQMRRNELAAPRRANQESLLSRSTTQTAAQPSELVSAPEQRVAVEQTPSLQASATALARTEATQPSQSRTTEMAAAVEVSRSAAQPAPRAQQEPNEPTPSTTAAVARATAAPADVPRTTAEAPTAVARTENIQQPEASSAATLARATSSPLARAEVEQPAMRTNTPAAIASQPRLSPDSQPTVTATTESAPARVVAQSAAVANPAAAAPAAVASNSSDPSRTTQTGPAPTEVTRAAVNAPTPAAIESNSTSSRAASAISQTSIARRQESGNLGSNLASQATSAPARAAAPSNSAASPVNLENPSLVTAGDATSAPSQSPAATSLTRSTAGETGIGQSPNFDRGMPAPATTAQVASAAAQRAASSIDSGAAPAASSPSALRRSQAQAQIDSATAVAQDAAPADYRAGAVPTQLDATSGAAVARSASAAPRGNIAAEAGNLQADTGAVRIVSRAGVARSDGGGQPNVAAVANPGQPGRASASGATVAAVASDVLAPSAAAPTISGVPAAGLSAQATGAARSAASASSSSQPSDIGGGAPANTQATAVAAAGAPSRSELSAPAAVASTTSGPARSAPSAQVAETNAQDVQVASTAHPAREPAGTSLDATTLNSNRAAAGLPGRTTPSPVGGGSTESSIAALNNGPSAIAAGAAARGTASDQPTVNNTSAAAPLARSTRATGEAAAQGAIDVPDVSIDASAPIAATQGDAQPGPSTGPSAVARRATGGVPVQIASVAGPGGLASELSAVVGSRKTSAQRESELIHDADTRFLGREIAGAVPAPSFIRDAAKAFERRGRDTGTGQGQQGAKTEEAIERGLEFLARSQQEDGSWSFQKFTGATDDDTGMIHSDTAATGLALMAFLGGGYDHYEDKHRDTVRRGLHFLLRQQSDNGDLYVAQEPKSHESAWLYSHAIASIALTEALGMTGDQELRGPAQRALDFIEAAQDRQFGGWRYEPGVDSDTSVAGWQLMALKSGELAGLTVKRETYDAARKWLDRAQVRGDGSQYTYNPTKPNKQYPVDQRRPTMTSVGLLMRLYLGWDRTRPEFKRGAEQILRYPAAYGTTSNPMRDTYYWYYATQFMFHMRGDHWQRWNNTLYPLLISSQITQGALSGSWQPGGNIADRWGPQGGRIYVTTMNLLSLEVYYRHLPIYEETAK